jgi:hypothetical protein
LLVIVGIRGAGVSPGFPRGFRHELIRGVRFAAMNVSLQFYRHFMEFEFTADLSPIHGAGVSPGFPRGFHHEYKN